MDDADQGRPPAVLVVEDEPLQRLDMLDLVRDLGYEPVEAWDADHAVAILEARPDVRVVFTDIEMPGSMDVLRLASHVRDRWPPIEIIVTTAGRRPDMSLLPERALFIPKPLPSREVARALRALVH